MHLTRLLLLAFTFTALVEARRVEINVLVTTDLHGNIYPYDYYTAREAPRGLAKIATLIQAERKIHSNVLLLDCGDTIQGAPLETTYQQAFANGKTRAPDPMMLAMNALGYDAMTVGNHEFNYGLANLENARRTAKFPWLSANTVASGGAKPFERYLIREIDGVNIAVIGITTPGIPSWEKPENYRGYRFAPGEQAVREVVAELKKTEKPDVILVAAHAGLDRNLKTGVVFPSGAPGENMVWQIANNVPGITAIVFGHTHLSLVNQNASGVELLQPQNWGGSLGRLQIDLEGEPGSWKVDSQRGTLIPVTAAVAPDEEILALALPYHEAAEEELNSPVAEAPVSINGSMSRLEDTAVIDAIQEVQLHYAHADVSFASSFNPSVKIPKGPVTVREIAALYVYDNELYGIEGNGRMVKEALENAARFYLPCPEGGCQGKPRTNPQVIGFNYDMAQGVSYEIDPSRPEGSRVLNLRYHGHPLRMDEKLRIALNNYRYEGSAGYTMFRAGKIVYRSQRPIRDLMIEYYRRKKTLPEKPDNNWKVLHVD